jgi:hypothetical protein
MKGFKIGVAIVTSAIGSNAAFAETRFEAAAGRAAGRVASEMVSHAVVRGAERFKGPACHRGADELRLRGLRRAAFVVECRKVL